MPTTGTQKTVGALVAEDTRRASIFEQLGVDYGCDGDRTLEEVCTEHELHPETVLKMLESIPDARSGGTDTLDVENMSLAELITHIESTHHVYLRRELPRIQNLLATVAEKHGEQAPWMHAVREVFHELKPELLYHLRQEEEVVFPLIRALEEGELLSESADSHQKLIERRESEHDEAGEALRELRELTNDFTPPEWACDTFLTAVESLERLEKDTHEHVHKENNILFQRAFALVDMRG